MTLLVVGWAWTAWKIHTGGVSLLYTVFAVQAFLLTAVRFIPWYAREDRGFGIEEHFQKIVVVVGYLLVLTPDSWPFLIFPNLFFLVLNAIAAVLIFFHFQDKDKTPPAFLSRSLDA